MIREPSDSYFNALTHQTVSGNSEKKVKRLEIQILKDEQYNRRNWIEFSGISDTINDDKLEERIIEACKAYY